MASRKRTQEVAEGISVEFGIPRKLGRAEENVTVRTAEEVLREKEFKAAERERVREEKKEKLLRERKEREDAKSEAKIAQILALANEIRRMIREMREVAEKIDSDEVLLKDKVAGLFKSMRCDGYKWDEIEAALVPNFLDWCTSCETPKSLHEVHLRLNDNLKPAWMCVPCLCGLARSTAFKERLNMVRQETRMILDGLMKRDDPEFKDMCLTLSEYLARWKRTAGAI